MFSSASGLGRLFSSTSQSSSQYQSQKAASINDSIVEETTTYDLLFPCCEDSAPNFNGLGGFGAADPLSLAATAKTSDDRRGLGSHAIRDTRIIVAQRAEFSNKVLFDTHSPSQPPPSPSIPASASDHALGGQSRHQAQWSASSHARQSSLSQRAQSIFTSSLSPLPSTTESSASGTTASRNHVLSDAKSSRHLLTHESESTSSKVAREEREETDDILKCMFGAPGFLPAYSTKIHVKPYTAQGEDLPGSSRGDSRSRSVTPLDDLSAASPRRVEQRRSFLSRSSTADALPRLSSFGANQGTSNSRTAGSYILITKLFSIELKGDEVKTISYRASDLSVNTNARGDSSSSSNFQRTKLPTFAVAIVLYMRPVGAKGYGVGSPTSERSYSQTFSSSLNSLSSLERRIQLQDECEGQVEHVMARWPQILRALASLEDVAAAEIKAMFLARLTLSGISRQRNPQLDTSALQNSKIVHKSTDATIRRVIMTLRIGSVVTGQERWTLWKTVARGLTPDTGSSTIKTLLNNLLTAFLAIHTEWLDTVGPKRYRQRQQDHERSDVKIIASRTVIVSPDKMLARRLVFLLSFFLPRNSSQFPPRPKITTANAALNRPQQSNSHILPRPLSSRRRMRDSVSVVRDDTSSTIAEDMFDLRLTSTAIPVMRQRRESDTRSIRSIALPIATTDASKTSSTSRATVKVHPQEAIPFFSNIGTNVLKGTPTGPRPGSSGSLAAISLQRTLSCTESVGTNDSFDSQQRNSFGSHRRESSIGPAEDLFSPAESLGLVSATQSKRRLNHLIRDLEKLPNICDSPRPVGSDEPISPSASSGNVPARTDVQTNLPAAYPLTLSIDQEDGVIDVEIPKSPEFSLPSSLASPRARRAHSFFDDHRPILSRTQSSEGSVNGSDHVAATAGWLDAFHPDFELQAVRPTESLKRELKYTMRIEAYAVHRLQSSSFDEWVEVSNSVIADTSTGTVTRLTLQRKNPTAAYHRINALLGYPSDPTQETFLEELVSISNQDDYLVNAIDRLLNQSSSTNDGSNYYTSTSASSRFTTRPSSPVALYNSVPSQTRSKMPLLSTSLTQSVPQRNVDDRQSLVASSGSSTSASVSPSRRTSSTITRPVAFSPPSSDPLAFPATNLTNGPAATSIPIPLSSSTSTTRFSSSPLRRYTQRGSDQAATPILTTTATHSTVSFPRDISATNTTSFFSSSPLKTTYIGRSSARLQEDETVSSFQTGVRSSPLTSHPPIIGTGSACHSVPNTNYDCRRTLYSALAKIARAAAEDVESDTETTDIFGSPLRRDRSILRDAARGWVYSGRA